MIWTNLKSILLVFFIILDTIEVAWFILITLVCFHSSRRLFVSICFPLFYSDFMFKSLRIALKDEDESVQKAAKAAIIRNDFKDGI